MRDSLGRKIIITSCEYMQKYKLAFIVSTAIRPSSRPTSFLITHLENYIMPRALSDSSPVT